MSASCRYLSEVDDLFRSDATQNLHTSSSSTQQRLASHEDELACWHFYYKWNRYGCAFRDDAHRVGLRHDALKPVMDSEFDGTSRKGKLHIFPKSWRPSRCCFHSSFRGIFQICIRNYTPNKIRQ